MSNIVIDGLSTCVTTSLELLLEQIDPESIRKEGKLPLLELKLELDADNGIEFSPPLGRTDKGKGVSDMIDNLIGSFLQVSTLFKRLDSEGSYMREMPTPAKQQLSLYTTKWINMFLEEFYLSIHQFCADFRANAPFKFDGECSEAYSIMERYAAKLDKLEELTKNEIEYLMKLK